MATSGRLILIDPIAYPQELPRIIRFASGAFGGAMARFSSPYFIVRRNVRQVYGDPDRPTEAVIQRYHELLLREGHREAMTEYFKVLRKYSTDDSLARRVADIQAPTLLMWGSEDRWVPPELIDRWRADVPQLEVTTYPGAGHVPMEEFPEETAADAHAFLAATPPATAQPPTLPAHTSGMPSWQ